MSHTRANIFMLIATLIWGTAFVSQTTGMGAIGPFTFSFGRTRVWSYKNSKSESGALTEFLRTDFATKSY